MRRADGGKAAGAGAVSQLGPGGGGRARRGRGASAAQPGLRVRGGIQSGGPGHPRSTRAAARCEHGPGAGVERGCPCPARGLRRRRGDPCEGGRRQQPWVSAPTSPERSGGLRGAGPKRGRVRQRIPAAGRSLAGAGEGGGAAGRRRCSGSGGCAPAGGCRRGDGGTGNSLQRVDFLGAATGFCTAGAGAFRGEADVCPRRAGGGGGGLPFFPVELSAFPQRGAVPGGEAEGQPRPSLPPVRARCEPRGEAPPSPSPWCPSDSLRAPSISPPPAQGRPQSRGQTSIANGGVSNRSSRLDAPCRAPEMRSGRRTGQAPAGLSETPGKRGLWI